MRKLATIRRIDSLDPIEGADKIEVATVGGWKVVAQKGLYNVGDLAVYFEIDSFIPTTLAPFLTKPGHFPKVFDGVEGERLTTIKLRGQLSQGLLMPLTELNPRMDDLKDYLTGAEGFDCTELLGILKWEKPISAQLAGVCRGNFPTLVPKTDQERIQNLKKELNAWIGNGYTFEVTEKLDGSSCTMYLDPDGDFHVCSRNLDLKYDEGNSFWKVAIAYNVEAQLREHCLFGFALQGELIGEGVQGNPYGVRGQDFRLYDIYEVDAQSYMDCLQRSRFTRLLGLNHVPVFDTSWKLSNSDSIETLLQFAEAKSELNPKTEREGLVFKCIEDPNVSFKAISNKFLLKGGEMMRASDLTEEQIEECIGGTTSIDMIYNIIEKTETPEGTIQEQAFADWFAYGLEGFIDADEDEDPEGWAESNSVNRSWGYDIAVNINDLLKGV